MIGHWRSLKNEGNVQFKDGLYRDALRSYTQALSSGPESSSDRATIYKNRAACHLKMSNNEAALDDATACEGVNDEHALDLVNNDPKALFRKCQALDALGRVTEAYSVLTILIKVDPKNSALGSLYRKLNPLMEKMVKSQSSVSNKVSSMLDLAADRTVPVEKRTVALNNLTVIVREEVGAEYVCGEEGVVRRLVLLLTENVDDVVVGVLRVLAALSKRSVTRASAVISSIDIMFMFAVMGQKSPPITSAVSHLIQVLLNGYAGLGQYISAVDKCEQGRKKGERPHWPRLELGAEEQAFVDKVFNGLIRMIDSGKVTAECRDAAMELVTKNVTNRRGFGWAQKFLMTDGVERLLAVAGTRKHFSTLPVTDVSRMHASVTLSTIYDDLASDKQREEFKDTCSAYLRDLFEDGVIDSKIEAIEIISSLLQGPYEVGSMLLGLEGVVQIMLTLADSDDVHFQRVAVEAIVHSASKKDRCAGILKETVPILKRLYHSTDEGIQVRALVGLCKLGSFYGGDVSNKPMADGSTIKLSSICRKFLVSTAKNCDVKLWAIEGLAYLTLDAEVKEELLHDKVALQAIFALASGAERNSSYACITVLVNLTNSYDKQEVTPEMTQLAKYAQQHIPEEHEKDKGEYVAQRINRLAEAGITNALVALSVADSRNCRELVSRVFVSVAQQEPLRGLLVQQGGVKALTKLMENNTDVGEISAAHALAKIAVTMNPTIAFPGQRMYEVVCILITLLHSDRTALQNFEALLALTNLSSVSESVRGCILSHGGLQAIENCMFEEHEMIRRAGTECMCNMMMSEEVQRMSEGENDRVKMLVLFAGEEEDVHMVRAASGALAFISSNEKLCHKITEVKSWLEILQQILVSDNLDIQHRACHTAMNLMAADKATSTLLVNSPVLEILMSILGQDGEALSGVRDCARAALNTAVEYDLIKPYNADSFPVEQSPTSCPLKPLVEDGSEASVEAEFGRDVMRIGEVQDDEKGDGHDVEGKVTDRCLDVADNSTSEAERGEGSLDVASNSTSPVCEAERREGSLDVASNSTSPVCEAERREGSLDVASNSTSPVCEAERREGSLDVASNSTSPVCEGELEGNAESKSRTVSGTDDNDAMSFCTELGGQPSC